MCTLLSIALILVTVAVVYLGRELRGARHALGLIADRLGITADKIGLTADRIGGAREVVNEPRRWLPRHGGMRTTLPSKKVETASDDKPPGAFEQGRDG